MINWMAAIERSTSRMDRSNPDTNLIDKNSQESLQIEKDAIDRQMSKQKNGTTKSMDKTESLDWNDEVKQPSKTAPVPVPITPRPSIFGCEQRGSNLLSARNPSFSDENIDSTRQWKNGSLSSSGGLSGNLSVPATSRTQKPTGSYEISQTHKCRKFFSMPEFRSRLQNIFNTEFDVILDISDAPCTVTICGRGLNVMQANDALVLLLENAISEQCFDQNRGFCIYKPEAGAMIQDYMDRQDIICVCDVSDQDGLTISYFKPMKKFFQSIAARDDEICKIVLEQFISASIPIPSEWNEKLIKDYVEELLEFSTGLSEDPTLLIDINKERDRFLLFGRSTSIKAVLAENKRLQQRLIVTRFEVNIEPYKIAFLLKYCEKELKELESEYRGLCILSCIQDGYCEGPLPMQAQIKSKLNQIVANICLQQLVINDKVSGLSLPKQEITLREIAQKYQCDLEIKNETSGQTCIVPVASLNKDTLYLNPALMSVDIRIGDLADQSVDMVVVCSTSDDLLEDILGKAGPAVAEDIREAIQAKHIDSDGYETDGGELLCQRLLFLPWITRKLDDITIRRSIQSFFTTALQHALKNGYTSLAFPALGCGRLNCEPKLIAEAMLDETQRYANHNLSILIVMHPEKEDAYEAFCHKLAELRRKKPRKSSNVLTYNHVAMTLMVTGYQQGVTQSLQEIRDFVQTCKTAEECDEFPVDVWDQATINSYFRYCLQQCVLPEIDGETCRLKLMGGKDDVMLTAKEFYRIKSEKAEEARLATYARIATWLYRVGPRRVAKYSLKLNALIEAAHHSKSATIKFKNDNNEECCITFDKMKETSTAGERDVMREDFRPPDHWTPQEDDITRIRLREEDADYIDMLNRFNQTMLGKYSCIRIERIQNKRWYTAYASFRRYFKKTKTEEFLFHGCPETSAETIINSCFNRSFAGVNGVVYGVGVYFSRRAAYSHCYTRVTPHNPKRSMLVARVLVGKSTVGNSRMKVPPEGFDSTTDGDHIIVTYHDDQAYAEYLITYESSN